MPIRRQRGPKPTLRHLAFLSAIAEQPESAPSARSLQAAFLTLRLLDEWMVSGEMIADPAFPVHAAARDAVGALTLDPETQAALSRIIDALASLREPDAQPVLPRVFAYGSLLEHRGEMLVAADAFATVSSYVDTGAHFDLAFDALMRQGFCYRVSGELERADRAYEAAGVLAGRARDRTRVLFSRIGGAKLAWARGNLPTADAALAAIATEAKQLGDTRVHAMALHDSAAVARARNDLPRALALVTASLRITSDHRERERLLADLGNFLGLAGAFTTARSALELLERIASQQEIRWIAQLNLMDLAAREGSEPLFEHYRKRLQPSALPVRNAIDYYRDAGRGLAAFGRYTEAEQAIARGLTLAGEAGMHQQEFELRALADRMPELRRDAAPRVSTASTASEALTDEIEALLTEVAASV